MALSGTLQTLSLAEIFQTLERSQATGVLKLVSMEGGREVVFESGNITNISITDEVSHCTLAQRLFASGIIEDRDLLEELEKGTGAYATINTLKSSGVSEDEITDVLSYQAQEELYNIFTWDQADFQFYEIGGGNADTDALIEDSRLLGISIPTSNVLLESARRIDDWQKIRSSIPSDNIIFSPVAGKEQELQNLTQDYPARTFVNYIDGVHSLEDMIKTSVATRLEISTILVDLLSSGLIVPLTTNQVIENAQIFEKEEFFEQAACLYRRALSMDPSNGELRQRLAHALTKQGEGPEAAACFAELAIGYLTDGNVDEACDAAKKSVALGGGHKEINTYIQCLESAGRIEDATEQMRVLAKYHVSHSQWSEAKEVCSQILVLEPKDDVSLDVLALASIHTCDLELKEFEVACVFCNQVNDRNNLECENCNSNLHKLCRNCHSEAACSDSVCLFCGKSPHILEQQEQESGLFENISEEDNELRNNIKRAFDLRNDGELDKSLALWKEISKNTSNNQTIHNHIRELEAAIHNQSIENFITRGNNFRRGRRFARAIKSYSEALRILSPRDPRKARLESILVTCRKDNQRTKMVYIIAGVALLITGWVVADPHIQYYFFKQEAHEAKAKIETIAAGGGGTNSFKTITALHNDLKERGTLLGDRAVDNLLPIYKGAYERAEESLSEEAIAQIQDTLADKNTKKAKTLLSAYKVAFKGYKREIIKDLDEQYRKILEQEKILAQLLADSPKLLADADQLYKDKRLGEALKRYKALVDSPDNVTSEKSKTQVNILSQQQSSFLNSMKVSNDLISSNLDKAQVEIAKLEVSSKEWGQKEQWREMKARLEQTLSDAEKEFNRIKNGSNQSAFIAFIAQYPGSGYSEKCRDLLNNLRNEQEAMKSSLDKISNSAKSKNWELLHRHGKRFVRSFGDKNADRFNMPLQINSVPSGAEIRINNEIVGKTPFLHQYKWNAAQDISISYQRFESKHFKLSELREQWKIDLQLNRTVDSKLNLRNKIFGIQKHNKNLVIAAKGVVYIIGADNKVVGSHSIGNLGMMADDLYKWSSFIRTSEEFIVVPTTNDTVSVLNAQGETINTMQLNMDIESQPLIYVNELFGGDHRLAVSDNGLSLGQIKGSIKSVHSDNKVISGPILVSDDFDQLLVFVSHTGQFIGFDESNKEVVWRSESSAAHVSKLIEIDQNQFLTTLDDSRLALFKIDLEGAKKVWDKNLPKSIIAAPVVDTKNVYLALKQQVLVYKHSGIKLHTIDLKEDVSSISAHAQAGIAIGCKSGLVKFFNNDAKLMWQLKLEEEPSALLVIENRVYIGTNNGHVFILSP